MYEWYMEDNNSKANVIFALFPSSVFLSNSDSYFFPPFLLLINYFLHYIASLIFSFFSLLRFSSFLHCSLFLQLFHNSHRLFIIIFFHSHIFPPQTNHETAINEEGTVSAGFRKQIQASCLLALDVICLSQVDKHLSFLRTHLLAVLMLVF